MSAIDFVVRGDAGIVERGSVAGATGDTTIIVGAGQDISLNLNRNNILSYVRQGQALQITLVDGQTITVEGYFSPEGAAENELFISANGQLSKVDLVAGEGNLLFSQYIDADNFGKWSPDDELFFVQGSEVMVAGVEAAGAEAGMMFAPVLGGLAGLGSTLGMAGAGVGAAVLVAGAAGADEAGEDPAEPVVDPAEPVVVGGVDPSSGGLEVAITSGTESAGHVVNAEDYADGIEIGGTGTPGASGIITVGGVSQAVEVDGEGNWVAHFDSSELADGEYEETVQIVLTADGLSATATDVLVVDTVAEVSVQADIVEGDGMVSNDEESDGVTLTGTTQPGSTVVVSVDGTDYDATVTDAGEWSVDLASGTLAQGEYDLEVTVTATDGNGNTASTTDTVHIDTVTDVTLSTAGVGGDDGVVNREEHSEGIAVNGLAEANASVVVTLGAISQTVNADANGNWSASFSSAQVPTGTLELPVTAVSTDAVGNTATATGTVQVDTDLDVAVDTSAAGGDGIVNAVEHAAGVTLVGTADAGAQVSVTFGTGTRVVTADDNGQWTADWQSSEIPTGELNAPVSVTATDSVGNVSTASGTVAIDTVLDVAVDTSGVAGDGVINAVEHASGVTLSGTASPNAELSVTFGTATRDVTATSSGTWSVDWASSEIPAGEIAGETVSVTATDAAGNTASTSGTVEIDTVIEATVTTGNFGGDNVVNAVEQLNGVTVSGTAHGAETVEINFGGAVHTTAVDASGNWTTHYNDSEVTTGETNVAVQVTSFDGAGNSATASTTVEVDTYVNELDNTGVVEGDDVVNIVEASDGITLRGVVEEGSTVMVDYVGGPRAATVNADGTWFVEYTGAEIPNGPATAEITATDEAGNTRTIEDTFTVDLVAPEMADVGAVTTADNATRGFAMVNTQTGETVEVDAFVDGAGTSTGVDQGSYVNPNTGELNVDFDRSDYVPDGSHLVVTTEDAAGNTNSTLVVLDEDGNSVVDMGAAALDDFNIGAIDLEFADDSEVTISVADLEALSGNDNSLVVHGDTQDSLTLDGVATATGDTQIINGQTYNVYSVGTNGGELIVSDDVRFDDTNTLHQSVI